MLGLVANVGTIPEEAVEERTECFREQYLHKWMPWIKILWEQHPQPIHNENKVVYHLGARINLAFLT